MDILCPAKPLKWRSMDHFCYTYLGPKSTGLSTFILIPCCRLCPSPFILVPKKGVSLAAAREKADFDCIPLHSTMEINKELKQFIEINKEAITRHWAQITDSAELCEEIKSI